MDLAEPVPDRDSIDCTLSAAGKMRPQIGAQLKATRTRMCRRRAFFHSR